MIEVKTVIEITKTMVDHLADTGMRSSDWGSTPIRHRERYVESMKAGLNSVGVKVEGYDGPKAVNDDADDAERF